jgi:hypothetical protein
MEKYPREKPINKNLGDELTDILQLLDTSVSKYSISSETCGGDLRSSCPYPLSTRELPEIHINPQEILAFILNITPPFLIIEDSFEESIMLSLETLKKRDMEALNDLFEREDVDDIAEEINKNLSFLLPALCWEEDALEFLRECA